MLNCESSEANRTCSIVEKIISKRSDMFILKNLNIEAKRTGSIVILYSKKRKGSIVNYRSFAIPSKNVVNNFS
jgi:hypothetical protein